MTEIVGRQYLAVPFPLIFAQDALPTYVTLATLSQTQRCFKLCILFSPVNSSFKEIPIQFHLDSMLSKQSLKAVSDSTSSMQLRP